MIRQILGRIFKDDEVKALYYNKIRRFYIKNIRADFLRLFLEDKKITNINAFEQRYYSQNGEDGIIRLVFDKIKTTNKFCVEFGIHKDEGNSIYLKKHGWSCLWMDGNGDGTVIKKEFITAENINELFSKYNVPREFDLLSIDIDFNDYWIWKAIKNYSPRVVIIEYNASIPVYESKAVEYNPNEQWDGSNYCGASLLALKRLGDAKGYTLIACDEVGVNAFFVREDLVKDNFKVDSIEKIFRFPRFGKKVNGKRAGHPASDRELIPV